MLVIVIHHYAYHGQVDLAGPVTSQTLGLQMLTFGGNVGVLLFAMMGAYFLNGKPFKWRRLLQLILETWIFSLVMLVLALIFKVEPLSVHELLDLLFPMPNVYWFLDYYLMLIMMTPFIYYLMNQLSKDNRFVLFVIFTVVLSIGPTFGLYHFELPIQRILVFLYLIYTMAWVKIDQPEWFNRKETGLRLLFIGFSLFLLNTIIVNGEAYIQGMTPDINKITFLSHSVTLMIAFGIFIFIHNLNLGTIPLINQLASASFGVYLIHEQPLVRQWLWTELFDNRQFVTFFGAAFKAIVSGIIVFIVCLMLSFIIQRIFGPVIKRLSYHLGERLDNRFKLSMTE
ncbi:acyltransferase [Aerococcaceae bacterium DSM 111020]|nr:acyltransferase [Aerococcaceae bacterium DSM 111020]